MTFKSPPTVNVPTTVAPAPMFTSLSMWMLLPKVLIPVNVDAAETIMSLETSSRLIVPTPVIFRFLPDTSSYTTSSKT